MHVAKLFVYWFLGLMHFKHTDLKSGADLVIESLRGRGDTLKTSGSINCR